MRLKFGLFQIYIFMIFIMPYFFYFLIGFFSAHFHKRMLSDKLVWNLFANFPPFRTHFSAETNFPSRVALSDSPSTDDSRLLQTKIFIFRTYTCVYFKHYSFEKKTGFFSQTRYKCVFVKRF